MVTNWPDLPNTVLRRSRDVAEDRRRASSTRLGWPRGLTRPRPDEAALATPFATPIQRKAAGGPVWSGASNAVTSTSTGGPVSGGDPQDLCNVGTGDTSEASRPEGRTHSAGLGTIGASVLRRANGKPAATTTPSVTMAYASRSGRRRDWNRRPATTSQAAQPVVVARDDGHKRDCDFRSAAGTFNSHSNEQRR